MRVGFTVTKKIGNAVVRNRMKRRFRALARETLPDHGIAGADHVLIGRAGGIERDYSSLAAELKRALKKVAVGMIAKGAHPAHPRLATGPEPHPSAILPLPAKLFGLCDYRTSALWRRQRRLARIEANLPLPSLGGTGPVTRFPDIQGQVNQVNDNKNMLLAIVLSALVLIGWSLLSDKFFPTAGPQTPAGRKRQGEAGPAAAGRSRRRRAPARSASARSSSPKRRGCGSTRPALQGSINLKGARLDDLVLVSSAKRSPRIRRRSACFRRPAPTNSYFAQFGWTGQGVAAPDANSLWTASAPVLSPGKPVTLSWTNPTGQRFEQIISVDDGYLFTVKQRVVNGGSGAVALRAYRPRQPLREERRPVDLDQRMSARSAILAARPIMTSTGKRSTRTRPAITRDSRGGWLGFTDKYWLTALAPANGAPIEASLRKSASGAYQADYAGPPFVVAPGPGGQRRNPPVRRRQGKGAARPLRGRRASPSFPSRSTGAGSNGSCGRFSTC